ncbi:MFS general substrate transporter [Ceraceosorus guamensis]|uniref:MFS general substrate transporter n=1 Tax=Ceraceosorus guamensis TaxID=1522189 RepID=A0A316W825_9BASI|nr:MFS general substrate transporter [Ceraceosorus guamensis]PWN46060.1 MFS general substrate transporter [Ceraceosorus guamensis]
MSIASTDEAFHEVRRVRSTGHVGDSIEGLKASDLFDETKTAKENKSLLMSYELERMGFGRYQLFVFLLCGLGFFTDLLFAQAFGLITVPLESEPDFGTVNDGNIGTLFTAFNVGLTVGAFSWGILVDVVGRKWSFYCTCLLASIFGLAAGGSPNFTALRVLVAFSGLGVGGNIPIDATITLEFLPTKNRWLLALLSLFQPIGVLVASGIAYGFVPNYSCGDGATAVSETVCRSADNRGWRYTLFTVGGITLGVFLLRFLLFTFRESPAYLVNLGKDREAIEVVKAIAKVNKADAPAFTMEDFNEIDRRCGNTIGEDQVKVGAGRRGEVFAESSKHALRQLTNVKVLFQNRKMARLTILLWITFICDFFAFNIAGAYLPLILSDRNIAQGKTLAETYRSYVAIYAPGIGACILAAALIELPRLGRQWSMVFFSALMGVSMFIYTRVETEAASVGLNALEYIAQSAFNAILYAYLPEVYPSSVRGTASGVASTLGRISGIVAPLIAGPLYSAGPDKAQNAAHVLYLGGGVAFAATIALIFLPFDNKGRRVH